MIDNDDFKIPGEYYGKPNNNIILDWMNDKDGYKETAEEVDADYIKGKNDNELKLVKSTINNKNNAGNEFKKLKQKVTNDALRQELIKNLERDLFGKEYEESIAERVKTRRQNTQRTFAPSSPPKKDYSAEPDEYLKYMEEQEKDCKKFSDEYDSIEWSSGSSLKILTNKQMLNRLPILLAQIQAGNNFKYDLIDKLDLKNPNKNMALASLSIYYTWKNVSQLIIITSLKYQHQHGMIHLTCLMDRIIYQKYKTILNI